MMMKTISILAIVSVCLSYSNACKYIGCFTDKPSRILEGGMISSSDMTIEKCVHHCSVEGYYFAGVEYSSQCFCGNYLKAYTQHSDSSCSTSCSGDSSQKCGQTWKISVYTTKTNYLGCYEDRSTRILEGSVISSNQMTTKMCITKCTTMGKRFALTQYSFQCFCGNHLRNYAKKPEADCSYNCAGNSNEKCGGFWRGSLYLTEDNGL
ncbi:hypothetical protein ACF0H5_024278 [Mactra antiquata]